jgi:hypothetical protein
MMKMTFGQMTESPVSNETAAKLLKTPVAIMLAIIASITPRGD